MVLFQVLQSIFITFCHALLVIFNEGLVMIDIILFTNSEYSHAKLEALSKLLENVEHIHVFGYQCERWEQMIDCSLNVTAISYPGLSVQCKIENEAVVCI